MKSEEARFSLKAGLWAGVLTLVFFGLTHIVGEYPHQPPWTTLEAFRGLILSATFATCFGVITYGYQFHSARSSVTPADTIAFIVLALIAWACLSTWHLIVVIRNGWPGADQDTVVVVPWLVLILQPSLFWLRRGDRPYWGLVAATVSLSAALMFMAIEINDRFLVR